MDAPGTFPSFPCVAEWREDRIDTHHVQALLPFPDGCRTARFCRREKRFRVETEVSDINDSLHTLLQNLDSPGQVLTDELSSPPKRHRGRRTGNGTHERQVLQNLAASGVARVEFARLARVSVDRVLRLIAESGGNVALDPRAPNCLLIRTGSVGLKEKSEFISERLSRLQ